MDNVDRFARLFYKDCDFEMAVEHYFNQSSISEFFLLKSGETKNQLMKDYLATYPVNYNNDALANMLEFYLYDFAEAFHKSYPTLQNFESTEALCFLLKSLEMLDFEKDEIRVKYKYLYEWDGMINKVDSDILVGLACSLKKKDVTKQLENVLPHNNQKLYDSLKIDGDAKTLCDNHQHLKASGYTTEMSIQALLHNAILYVEKIADDMDKIEYNEKLLGEKKSLVVENLCAIKLIRVFLFDMMEKEPKFTSADRKAILRDVYNGAGLLTLYPKYDENISILEQKMENSHNDFVKEVALQDKTMKIKRYFMCNRDFFKRLFDYRFGNNSKNIKEFSLLLNLYIAGISKLRFVFAQDNLSMGFEKFKIYEDRKDTIVGNIKIENKEIYKSVFDRYIAEGTVKKVEFRIGPPKSSQHFYKMMKDFEYIKETYGDRSFEYGIIVHFIKSKKLEDLATSPNYHRYELYLNKQKKALNILLSLLEKEARIRENTGEETCISQIVGIDTANYEIDCPPEVFVGMFHEICTYAPDMKKTFHVGEDFRNITTGLRRVDEAMEFLKMEDGDRLGHASALGLDIQGYFDHTRNYANCTQLEWLDDLAWLWHCLNEVGYVLNQNKKFAMQSHLEREFDICYQEISTRVVAINQMGKLDKPIETYWDAMNLRGDWMKADDAERKKLENGHGFLELYFRNVEFYNELKQNYVQKIDDDYIVIVKTVQQHILTKLINNGIVIEANPSSNRKISYVEKNASLPVVELINRFAARGALDNLCINTDDSSIFQTNLTNEYSIIAKCYEQHGTYNVVKSLMQNSEKVSFVK